MIIKKIKGCIFVLSLFLTSLLGSIFFLLPFLLLIFTLPIIYRAIVDVVAMIENFLGIEVLLEIEQGTNLNINHCFLIIMNHYSRVDWLFFWSCLYRLNFLLSHKIILKAPLKNIPGAGWAMQMANFIFLQRDWEKDKIVFSKAINYLASIKYPCKILLFPEGTDFSPNNICKSKEYALKNDLQIYHYLLQPRVKGFAYLIDLMKKENRIDTILDVTVSYHNADYLENLYEWADLSNEELSESHSDIKPDSYNMFYDDAHAEIHKLPTTQSQRFSHSRRYSRTRHHSPGISPEKCLKGGGFVSTDLPKSFSTKNRYDSPCTEAGILKGLYPDVVKFSCRSFDVTSVPTDSEESAGKWLRSLWASKDEILKREYEYCQKNNDENQTCSNIMNNTFVAKQRPIDTNNNENIVPLMSNPNTVRRVFTRSFGVRESKNALFYNKIFPFLWFRRGRQKDSTTFPFNATTNNSTSAPTTESSAFTSESSASTPKSFAFTSDSLNFMKKQNDISSYLPLIDTPVEKRSWLARWFTIILSIVTPYIHMGFWIFFVAFIFYAVFFSPYPWIRALLAGYIVFGCFIFTALHFRYDCLIFDPTQTTSPPAVVLEPPASFQFSESDIKHENVCKDISSSNGYAQELLSTPTRITTPIYNISDRAGLDNLAIEYTHYLSHEVNSKT